MKKRKGIKKRKSINLRKFSLRIGREPGVMIPALRLYGKGMLTHTYKRRPFKAWQLYWRLHD